MKYVLCTVERVRAAAECVMGCLAFAVVARVASNSGQRVAPTRPPSTSCSIHVAPAAQC